MTSTSTTRLIGAHVSAAGGIQLAVKRAADIGCNAVQVFSASPRVWARPPLENIDASAIAAARTAHGICDITIHALYLVNLASENMELAQKSCQVLEFDLNVAAKIGARGVIVHVGSHQGRGWEAVREQVATYIHSILKNTPKDAHFLIENSAGQQGKIGSDLAEIRWLLDRVNSPRLGWCCDTCHAWAAGYALHPQQPHTLFEEITKHNLWPTLRCVHVNGSRDPFSSGRDRHANIGEGTIPDADLRALLAVPQLANLPLILEVPGVTDEGPDAENVRRLRTLVQ
jgi:deoxyribonuclease-4